MSASSSAQPPPQVRELLQGMQQILITLPPPQRIHLTGFWAEVRRALDEQQREIVRLSSTLPPASRPTTSASVDALRWVFDEELRTASLQADEVSNTIEAIYDMDPLLARQYIQARRNAALEASPSNLTGECWLASMSEKPKINLRHTKKPGTNKFFDASPYCHQLAVVAAGEGAKLLGTQVRGAAGELEVRLHYWGS